MKFFVAFIAGVLFAVGLVVSGMTTPTKVTGFLDFFGNWDPSLALVMMGAIGVHLVPSYVARQRPMPTFSEEFRLPTSTDIDGRLLGGAALFGVGWAMSGLCPGPAVVAAAGGTSQAVVFLVTMLVGFAIYDAFGQPSSTPSKAR